MKKIYTHIYVFFFNGFLITISRANINTNESFYVTRTPRMVVRLRSHSASNAFNYIVASPAIFRVSPHICMYARNRVVFFRERSFYSIFLELSHTRYRAIYLSVTPLNYHPSYDEKIWNFARGRSNFSISLRFTAPRPCLLPPAPSLELWTKCTQRAGGARLKTRVGRECC